MLEGSHQAQMPQHLMSPWTKHFYPIADHWATCQKSQIMKPQRQRILDLEGAILKSTSLVISKQSPRPTPVGEDLAQNPLLSPAIIRPESKARYRMAK